MFWSVVQTESQRENTAADFLQRDRFETYAPRCIIKQTGRRRIAPLFPTYIFVRIVDRWYSIRWTVGVLRLLMSDEQPARVPDGVVEKIQKREGEDGLIRLPKARGLQRGDLVRVIHGSFAGQLAIYDGMSGVDRTRVLLDLMGRKVPTVMAFRDVVACETTV